MINAFDLAYLGGAAVSSPWLAFKWVSDARFRHAWPERLGAGPRRDGRGRPIWFHAASVGEVNAIRALGRRLAELRPGLPIAITSMTLLGRENAARTFPGAWAGYAPLDYSPCVRRFVHRLRPAAVVLVEQELWPNMILEAPCPVLLVNARMTARSAEGYRRVGGVFRKVFGRLDLVLAQNDEYARRYRELGAKKVRAAGNLKFDSLPEIDESAERRRWEALGDPLLVAGSTHAPEEEIVLGAYGELRKSFPSLRLVLAPRHLERVAEVVRITRERGFEPFLISQGIRPIGVGILDTMGELYKLYAAARAVFVGGSFAPRGGQSIIEPASLGKPTVTGPGLENFADVAETLQELGALRIARTTYEVAPLLAASLSEPERAATGREYIRSGRGSTAETAAAILEAVAGRSS